MEPLPSLFDLPAGSLADALVVVATRMAGPLHPFGVQSWDLTLHGEGFDALSSDPFSFAGEFPVEGLTTVRGNLLEPAGFTCPTWWHSNQSGTEFHATIEWMAQLPR